MALAAALLPLLAGAPATALAEALLPRLLLLVSPPLLVLPLLLVMLVLRLRSAERVRRAIAPPPAFASSSPLALCDGQSR